MTINVISMSGGKDSTATALLALERGGDNRFLFADTGHEHAETYRYLEYLQTTLHITIETVKADLADRVIKKRTTVREKWVREGAVTPEQAEEICKLLEPTGNPFLDLCMSKGRFPSTRARFCSEELKHFPLDMRMLQICKEGEVTSWQGVRADESPSRAKLPETEQGDIYTIYRPILKWTAEEVFRKHAECGIEPNPLYKQGMSRVGCMPCIHARKSELAQIAKRFPMEVQRVAEWEKIVSMVSKRGNPTFFHASTDPTIATKDNDEISIDSHGIMNICDWAMTSRGGRQRDWIASSEDITMCSSAYGLCE